MLAFVLVALGYAYWSFLALTGGLPAFGVTMVLQAVGFVVLATGRWVRPLAAGIAALEVLGYFLAPQDAVSIAIDLVVVAGFAILAWRQTLAPGAYVAAAGFLLSLVGSALGGFMFLVPGTAFCLAGMAALSWQAMRAQPVSARSAVAQAGGRP